MESHATLLHKTATKSGNSVKNMGKFSLFPTHIMAFPALIFMNS